MNALTSMRAFCVTSSNWNGAVFDHNKTPFPLTGAHRATACRICHLVDAQLTKRVDPAVRAKLARQRTGSLLVAKLEGAGLCLFGQQAAQVFSRLSSDRRTGGLKVRQHRQSGLVS
jgi:hypothetical protein